MTFGDAAADADIVLAGAEWQAGALAGAGVQTPAGAVAYRLHIAGRHNVRNALAAVACALAAGVPLDAIAQRAGSLRAGQGPLARARRAARRGRTLTLVDDTYNANPDSVRAAIDVLAELPGPRLLVLGDMGEVGDQGPQFHAEVGDYARAARHRAAVHARATQARRRWAGPPLRRHRRAQRRRAGGSCRHAASVLVKGSRFMKMERVVQAITAHANNNNKEAHRDAA